MYKILFIIYVHVFISTYIAIVMARVRNFDWDLENDNKSHSFYLLSGRKLAGLYIQTHLQQKLLKEIMI